MIVKPRVRGFICTTAHPVGCALCVQEQIDWVKSQKAIDGPRNALIIGASTGYGLASRIVAGFGSGASTIGVFFEKPASGNRTATPGWYNSVAFERAAREAGAYAKSINGDAFSDEIKEKTIETIKSELGKLDLVIYSLAAPRRIHPRTGETLSAVLKPIGSPFMGKTVNVESGEVSRVAIDPASPDEIAHTVSVMGGEDWEMWIRALGEAEVLSERIRTIAYTYIGSELTKRIYRDGTIGKAKDHLEATAQALDKYLKGKDTSAIVSANKAIVTQSSAAIPVVPLYISILYKVMKDKGIHEGCIEQIYRLFKDRLYSDNPVPLDEKGRIHIDELELREDVQSLVLSSWEKVNTENLASLSDIEGYRSEFLKLFGFGLPSVDYEIEVDPDQK